MEIDIGGVTPAKLQEIIAPETKEVLDVGCGDGRMTCLLEGSQRRLFAIDVDVDAIGGARRTCRWACFTAASGGCLPFPAASFDCVVFSQSLHHQNSQRALQEAERVLRPDGRIIVIEPVIDGTLDRMCDLIRDEATGLLKALYAALDCGLQIGHREVFETIWRFENREELHHWLFEHYQVPHDPQLAERVDAILEGGADSVPLEIQEKLLLLSLEAHS